MLENFIRFLRNRTTHTSKSKRSNQMKIILDFENIDKMRASELLNDLTKLSLTVAEKALLQLSEKIPNPSQERLLFEIQSEIFLFNMIRARDALLQRINAKLNSPLSKSRVELNERFREKLRNDSNLNFRKILTLISDVSQEPEKVIITDSPEFWEWDRSKSWLWEINRMRNDITHRNILPQQIAVSVGSTQEMNTSVIVASITKPPIVRINGETMIVPIPTPKTESLRESNIKDYFLSCYDKFVNLNKEISTLLYFSRALDLSS